MSWVDAVQRLRRERRPGVLVTVADVRGHAPREPGAKLVVAADATWGTVGGGNLEETVLVRARAMIAALESGAAGVPVAPVAPVAPETMVLPLHERARTDHGRQCCGGEVTLLLEPLPVVPAVAVFGLGHVGLELARILVRHDVELHLADSRAAMAAAAGALDGPAGVHVHHAPVPELVLGTMPAGTHVLVLTHDHAEDFALCDAALRCAHLGPVGLIGSAAKWQRFRRALLAEGHPPAQVDRIRCPIGRDGPAGKAPATVAVAVAAELLHAWAGHRAPAGRP